MALHGDRKSRSGTKHEEEYRVHQSPWSPSHALTSAVTQRRIPWRQVHLRSHPHDADTAAPVKRRPGLAFGVIPDPMALVIVLAAGAVADPHNPVRFAAVPTGFAVPRDVLANAPGVRTMPGTAHRVVGKAIGKRAKRANRYDEQEKPLPSRFQAAAPYQNPLSDIYILEKLFRLSRNTTRTPRPRSAERGLWKTRATSSSAAGTCRRSRARACRAWSCGRPCPSRPP